MTLRFDGRVAIVTGAGHGLGRAHVMALAERGARVIVNDLGSARDGSGASDEPAQQVVEEIRSRGGEALADAADVTDPEQVGAMVARAVEAWGRVDILVNNAGILRDKTFLKMELEDFRAVVEVHLMGSVHCTKAVWGLMREQAYGRVVMTTSSSGLYGNFGQSNYGAAKMALVGLMNTLALEGAKYDIRVNCLSPSAATRMTQDLRAEHLLELMAPEAVSPGLLYLVSDDAPSRVILTAGAGTFARARIHETAGVSFKPGEWTPENVAAGWDAIGATDGQQAYGSGAEQTKNFLTRAAASRGLDLGGGGAS